MKTFQFVFKGKVFLNWKLTWFPQDIHPRNDALHFHCSPTSFHLCDHSLCFYSFSTEFLQLFTRNYRISIGIYFMTQILSRVSLYRWGNRNYTSDKRAIPINVWPWLKITRTFSTPQWNQNRLERNATIDWTIFNVCWLYKYHTRGHGVTKDHYNIF